MLLLLVMQYIKVFFKLTNHDSSSRHQSHRHSWFLLSLHFISFWSCHTYLSIVATLFSIVAILFLWYLEVLNSRNWYFLFIHFTKFLICCHNSYLIQGTLLILLITNPNLPPKCGDAFNADYTWFSFFFLLHPFTVLI